MQEEYLNADEEIEWAWLRPHLERDAVIVVAADLALGDAARRIAADDTGAVSAWIAAGRLRKPSAEQLVEWNAAPEKRFRMQIVQPYVLVQGPLSQPQEEMNHER